MLSAGVHGWKRSCFLLLFLNMLLVVEGSSEQIPWVQGNAFRSAGRNQGVSGYADRAEVLIGIGSRRQMRNWGMAEL